MNGMEEKKIDREQGHYALKARTDEACKPMRKSNKGGRKC